MSLYKCDECGKLVPELVPMYKQIAGEFRRREVCQLCMIKHEEHLEDLRNNFQIQFGEK